MPSISRQNSSQSVGETDDEGSQNSASQHTLVLFPSEPPTAPASQADFWSQASSQVAIQGSESAPTQPISPSLTASSEQVVPRSASSLGRYLSYSQPPMLPAPEQPPQLVRQQGIHWRNGEAFFGASFDTSQGTVPSTPDVASDSWNSPKNSQ